MLLPLHSTSRVCRRTYGFRGTVPILRGLCGLVGLLVIASPRLHATLPPDSSVDTLPVTLASSGTFRVLSTGLAAHSGSQAALNQQPPGSAEEKNGTSQESPPNKGDANRSQSGEDDPTAAEQATKVRKPPVAASPSVNLLAGNLEETWTMFSSKENTRLSDVWKVVESGGEKLLICTGTPKGFLITKRQYQNFELSFEWKYVSDPNGNSGVLAFTKNEPRLWPTSLQVQLHQPSAGSIFPSGDATSDSAKEATGLALEIGKWNKCRVVARNGKVSVEINGKQAGEVSGCNPYQGSIALQSEGSETHFRRIVIRELPEQAPSIADETSTSLPQPDADSPGGSTETDG